MYTLRTGLYAFLSLSPAATWKRNKLGDLSTAGTTACTVVFRQDHFYVANVGDSSAVMGKCGGGGDGNFGSTKS